MTNLTMGTLVLGFYRGVLMELYEAYQKMDADPAQGRLLLCGNALRNNPLLRSLCAELFGREACLTDRKEETATGVALLARFAAPKRGCQSAAEYGTMENM